MIYIIKGGNLTLKEQKSTFYMACFFCVCDDDKFELCILAAIFLSKERFIWSACESMNKVSSFSKQEIRAEFVKFSMYIF